MRVEADEGVDGEEGESVNRLSPGEEPDHAVLEYKDGAYSCVEAAEIVAHCADAEVWLVDVFTRAPVHGLFTSCAICGYDL